MELKQCNKCGMNFPANTDYFYASKGNKGGLNAQCKPCVKSRVKEYAKNNPDKKKQDRTKYKDYYSEYMKKYYQENKAHIDMMNKEYYLANKEKVTEYKNVHYQSNKQRYIDRAKKYRINNIEKCRMSRNKWRKANRAKEYVYKMKRKQREANSFYYYSKEDWENALRYFDNKCAYCGHSNDSLEKDHFIPLTRGGSFINTNIVPACRSCNSSKNNRLFEEWYPKHISFSTERYYKVLKFVGVKNNIQQLSIL